MKLDELKESIEKGNLNVILDANFFYSTVFLKSQPTDMIQSCSWWLGSFFTHSCNSGCAFSTCVRCSEGCSYGCSSCEAQI